MGSENKKKKNIHVLIIDDSEEDAVSIVEELRRNNFHPIYKRIDNSMSLIAELSQGNWDIVLSDYAIPQFKGMDILCAVKEIRQGIPFIFVSRTMDEVTAGAAMRAGAHDFFAKGNIVRLPMAIEREISEVEQHQMWKNAENKLHLIEERQNLLLKTAPMVLYTAHASVSFVRSWLSDNVQRITGFTAFAFYNDPDFWASRLHPEDKNHVLDTFQTVLVNGSFSVEYRWQCADGSWRWFLDQAVLIRENENRLEMVGSWLDISEQKKLESQFRQSQKMEAVGRLAAGVAHDFNNLLTAISGYAELAERGVEDSDPVNEDIKEVRNCVTRAASLTRQLLAFSRKQVLMPEVLNLNNIIKDMQNMARRIIGEDIELISHYDTDLGKIKADSGQIEQVIMNLIVNARDAMPRGGKLVLQTANVVLDKKFQQLHPEVRVGSYVMLEVIDTGEGMTEETCSRLFEPFFTTKPLGKGSGLGLATVYGIIKQSEGYIYVESVLGKGSSFRIFLPLTMDAERNVERKEILPEASRGTETILVVEDENSVRDMARRILMKNGYDVLEAKNAGEALLICENHQKPIQFMLSDVVMPQLSGPDLAKRLAPLHPEMKVLYMTGYSEPDVLKSEVINKGKPIIYKPFTPEDLTKKIREVLQQEK